MDESDAGAPSTGTGGLVDKPRSLFPQMLQGDVDRGNRKGNVVQSLTSALEEAPDRCLDGERLQKLDEGSSHRDHRLFDTLGLHDFPIKRLDPVTTAVIRERSIQVMHRDRHVVEIDQLHRREAKAPGCQRGQTPAAGSIHRQ